MILASDVFHSGSNLETLLFGSLLVLDRGDVVLAGVASVLALGGSVTLGRRWLAIGFDPDAARALGVGAWAPDLALLVLVALATTAALSAVGALLTTALFVVPAATTRLFTRRMGSWQVASVALAALEGTVGLWLSVKVNAPPGATIATLAGGVFVVAALARYAPRPSRRVALAGAGALPGRAGAGGLRELGLKRERRLLEGRRRRDHDPARRLRPRHRRRAPSTCTRSSSPTPTPTTTSPARATCRTRRAQSSSSKAATSSTPGWARSSHSPAATRR